MGEAYDHEKRLIRRRMQERRAGLSRDEVARCSAAVSERVLGSPVFAAARHVVAYLARGNELDPTAIVERAGAAGKHIYYPRPSSPGFEGGAAGETVPADDEAILFLVPGVAFDFRGVRLGRGGGWYDRALAAHPHGVRVGLGYEFQVMACLPEAPWDVRVHAVVTDVRVLGEPLAGLRALKETRTWT